jgi:N-ethylmaleimide reductase
MSDTLVEQPAELRQTSEEMLFQPYQLWPYHLPHRIVMAPLTRSRTLALIPNAPEAPRSEEQGSRRAGRGEISRLTDLDQGFTGRPVRESVGRGAPTLSA